MFGLATYIIPLIVLLLAIACDTKRRQDSFRCRFPPLSDGEFLARCHAGVNPQVALKVRRIVAESLGIEYERVHPESRFREDLDCD